MPVGAIDGSAPILSHAGIPKNMIVVQINTH